MRRSFRILEAWERLRARKNPGTAMAASKAMMATTIMISTSVKPPRLGLIVSFLSMTAVYLSILIAFEREEQASIAVPQLIPCHSRNRGNDRRMNREDSYW